MAKDGGAGEEETLTINTKSQPSRMRIIVKAVHSSAEFTVDIEPNCTIQQLKEGIEAQRDPATCASPFKASQ